MRRYVVIKGEIFFLDTDEDSALTAMKYAGMVTAPVWETPSSERDPKAKKTNLLLDRRCDRIF